MRLIIGRNKSDLILPTWIMKPSGQSHADRIPYTVETPLGWAFTNWLTGEQKVASPYNAVKVYETSTGEEEELQRLLTAQSEVESLGVVKLADPVRSIESSRTLSVMEQTTKKLDGEDAYVSGLLWREDSSLPNKYDMAERRLKNDPEIKERYAKSIQDDIEKGYVRKLSEEEVCTDSKVTWYLPHRFVINSKKPDRLRRVYDASAKIRGQSLNDKMYTGPDYLSLFGVLL